MRVVTKAELRRLIPHTGTMCLLDTVEQWNESQIVCRTGSHREVGNPLRRGEILEAICGLEYAVQAMAVHVGILTGREHRQKAVGYLGAVRDVTVRRRRLDDLRGDLTVQAKLLIGDDTGFVYTFHVSADHRELLSGRAAIFLKTFDQYP